MHLSDKMLIFIVLEQKTTLIQQMSRHYWYADKWRDFEQRLSMPC